MIKRDAYTFGLSEWERFEKILGEKNYSVNKDEGKLTVPDGEKQRTVANVRYGKVQGVDCVDVITLNEGLEKVLFDFSENKA